ncbi:hypothetical protein CTAM01_10987 [Colletotrichum tamarilloi]|uniref:Centrosomin N-terminal motif 1 domain-containing protein n=1 Tax=Colletotrichum tamarilloi TaxID=1209934 RepID=A0ABQ9QZ20_9PEZI|nr:uncharacterized protein CTAM01_10987 [Colletotrichum tamarilloi]KAK1489771.1 hypothetical protein CTAM01_10987 [Colletotrichum tamarilloi]
MRAIVLVQSDQAQDAVVSFPLDTMDSLARTQSRDRERSLPSPVYPRPTSRSSTSTSATRRTPRSANSSTSHFVTSPRPPSAHPAHKFHHSSCTPSMVTSRPGSAVSRDRVSDSGRQSAASTYLQDKLQRRREEADRLAAVRSTQDMAASVELPPRHAQSSPVKGESVDGRRPRSSGGNGESTKNKGMGAKEMEATVSTLHKQNFDLKLELFHRRERQNALEERVDALESEKAQIDDVNDKLLDELEKRDKAVQEAVQMIVTLEAQVETLLKEREMVRMVDAAGFLPPDDLESRLRSPTPKPRIADLARLEDDAKTLNRMPSFLSDYTENTENLRKVYLSSRGSLLSLPRLNTEAVDETDPRRGNGMTSPSLSVLSESSFVSVYGEKEDQDQTIVADADEPHSMDGALPHSAPPRKASYGSDQSRVQKPPTTMSTRSSRPSRSSSTSRAPGPGQFQSLHDIIDHTSPLQKLARLDHNYLDSLPVQDSSPMAGRGQSQKKTKDAKREALRRVTTDSPASHPGEGLPPTPDTISTSTLRRFKTSNDTLSKQRAVSDQHSYRSVSRGTSKDDEGDHGGGARVFQHPPSSAFTGSEEPASAHYFDSRPPLIPRPRSADETTISNHRELDWDSDGDSMHSLDSSLDIWLQQGKDPKYIAQQRSESPDLFSFPPSGGWNTAGMFGSSGGAFEVPGLPPPQCNTAEDALFQDGVQPLPPPNRRSSLGAKTGQTSSKNMPINGKLRKSPSRSGSRRNSVDAQMIQLAEAVANSPQHDSKTGARSKDSSHYPPSSTAAPRGHRLNFFRRSIGGSTAPSPVQHASPVAEPPAPTAPQAPMGVPSWVQRNHPGEGDRVSATPPPILRNPRPARSGSFDEGAPVYDHGPTAPTTPMANHAPNTPNANGTPGSTETTPTSNSASGGAPLHKRKWLPGFGRASSLRNRAG